jgi:hypothetical protein
MPNLKVKRVIGIYKPEKKLTDEEVQAKFKKERE